MLSLLAFVALSLTTWAQNSDFQEGQFYYSINRDRPSEVSVAYNTITLPLPVNSLFQVPLPMGNVPTQ